MSVIIEDLAVSQEELDAVQYAIAQSIVSGSIGSTYMVERRSLTGELEVVDRIQVARIGYGHSAGWRVVDAQNPALVGLVFVRSGSSYVTHAS